VGFYNDSVATEGYRTIDGPGGRWGISTGKIWLGGLAANICGPSSIQRECGLANRLDDHGQWLRRYVEIEDQARRASFMRDLRGRAEAIRVRRDAERDSASGQRP